MDSHVLEAVGLAKRFPLGAGWVDALRGVDFHVDKGEIVAVIGPSGCGKSTLLHLAGGLFGPSVGTMLVDGVSLATLTDGDLARFRRERIGFVFQFYNLIPTLDTVENIGLPLLLAGEPLDSHGDRLLDLAELFGLRGREHHKPGSLSAGEQQRVAIARALVMRPSIVLADEPTGNLDTVNGREVLQLLWEACVNFQQTMLVVTHGADVARFADRLYFMRDGRLIEELGLGRKEEHGDVSLILGRLQELHL